MIIIGIDQGLSNIGWSIIEVKTNTRVCFHGIINTNADMALGDRINYIYQELEKVFDKFADVDLVCIEKLNGNKVRNVGYVNGLIFMLAGKKKAPVLDFVPSSVKKEITGNGRADKDLVKDFILKETGATFKTDHECDSVAIAMTGFKKLKTDKKVFNKFNKEATKYGTKI